MDHRGQERHQQSGVGRIEQEVAAEQAHVGAAAAGAVANLARGRGHRLRVDALGTRRLEARHGEAGGRGQEHEVARLEDGRGVTVDGEPAAALKHDAEARLAEVRIADGPAVRRR